MESQGNKVVVAVVTLVIGLAVGGGVGYAVSHNNDKNNSSSSTSTSKPSSATKAADLRANLVELGVEHMDLTYSTVASTLNGSPSAKADGADLYKNGQEIAAAVGSVYGKDAENTVNKVWKLHLDEFVKYAVAASKHDDAGKKAALAAIDAGYTKPLAAYLANANPNLPKDVLYKSLKGHVDMTAVMIDDEASGNFTAATALREKSADHLKDLFSTLAGGIVQQFPDKF